MNIGKIGWTAVVLTLALALSGAVPQGAEQLYKSGLYEEEVGGNLQKAIGIYQDVLKRFPESRETAAKAQLRIGLCYEKLGLTEAEKAYQKVIADYPDRPAEVKTAKEKLAVLLKARAAAGAAAKGLSVRMIWSGLNVDSVGRPSPDGRFLSYIDQGTGALCVKELSSGTITVVTKKEGWGKSFEFALNSCWSADGKKLAYGWFNKENFIELRTIDRDGSNVRILYRQKDEMAFPGAWSPDGKSIAIGLARVAKMSYSSYILGLVSAEDGSLKILKTPNLMKSAPGNPVFSPDGRYVIVNFPQGENDPIHDIFAFSVDGLEETRIAAHRAEETVVDWVPGTNDLLFLSDRTGTRDAWTVEFADGKTRGEPRLARNDLGQIVPLGLSRDGSFFYRRGAEMADIAVAAIDLEKHVLIERPQTLPMSVIGVNSHPQWSPDGRFLAFLSTLRTEPGGRSKSDLVIRNADTGETREVKTNLTSLASPRWAPDGKSIFVVGSDGKTFLALFGIEVSTGHPTFYIDSAPGANIKFISPAPDGKAVYYTDFEFAKKRCRIMRIDLATKETRELYRQDAPPDIGGLGVSPEGKSLVFGTVDQNLSWILRAIPLPGGPPREIVRSKINPAGVSQTYFWSPDGKQILFFTPSAKENGAMSELWAVPFEGGEPRNVGPAIGMKPTIVSLHPDGRRLAFAFKQASFEVWVMENFLPVNKK